MSDPRSHTVPISSPQDLIDQLPASPESTEAVEQGRRDVRRILARSDQRLLVVVGPCSIHDPEAAWEYAGKLAALKQELPELVLVMRTYFEKPRTSVGWKGLINDPHLDGSLAVEEGLAVARRVLSRVTELGLATATEFVDPFTHHYLGDLVSWGAIGARTADSQTHRQMASGLPMPVGLKNPLHGDTAAAVNAVATSRRPHRFLDLTADGRIGVSQTSGNPESHIILRGADHRTNYDADSVESTQRQLTDAGLEPVVVVDCSHGNSGKQAAQQPVVAQAVVNQRLAGNDGIVGLMLESNLTAGRQTLEPGETEVGELDPGVSVTDECLGWDETESLLRELNNQLAG